MPSTQQSGVIRLAPFSSIPTQGGWKSTACGCVWHVNLPDSRVPAQRAGAVITREELREQVWGSDTFVDFEHGLNAAINKLRQTLGTQRRSRGS
jgi:hypothetical protein